MTATTTITTFPVPGGLSNGRRAAAVFVDFITAMAVVFSIPVAVLVIGTPLAIALNLLLRLGRIALGLF